MRLRQVTQFVFLFGASLVSGFLLYAAQATQAQNLDKLIDEKNYSRLELQLRSAALSADEQAYFEGILADRLNQPSRAVALIQKVLPTLVEGNRKRAALALNALASDEFMLGQYSEAVSTYAELLRDFGSLLDTADRRAIQDNHDTMALLGDTAPQRISGQTSFKVTTRRNALGLLEVPVNIAGNTEWWIFDTGANISTISMSMARRLELSLSKGRAQTQGGATGAEVPVLTAMIPELTFGVTVVHNVVVMVMDDKDLNVDLGPGGHYQIDAVLGYPVLAAIGNFNVKGSQMQVNAATLSSERKARLYVEQLTPLVSATIGEKNLVFQFDTGNTGADLTARFLNEFRTRFASLKPDHAQFGGVGGGSNTAIYRLPQLTLSLGAATAKFKNITLVAGDRGELLDKLYGNLGQGLLKQFESYTIDFNRMQLSVGDPALK